MTFEIEKNHGLYDKADTDYSLRPKNGGTQYARGKGGVFLIQ